MVMRIRYCCSCTCDTIKWRWSFPFDPAKLEASPARAQVGCEATPDTGVVAPCMHLVPFYAFRLRAHLFRLLVTIGGGDVDFARNLTGAYDTRPR